jgi:hypothetical protein
MIVKLKLVDVPSAFNVTRGLWNSFENDDPAAGSSDHLALV